MVALVAAPVVEQRFDASGSVWSLEDLDKQVGGFFEGRDPSVGFAADSIMRAGGLMDRLAGKVAIVTGGAMGQGAGICRAYVAEGAKVVIADVAKDEGQALADELGESAALRPPRRQRPGLLDALVADTNERFGPVTILANNAGILRFGSVEKMPIDEVELLFRVNQLGCWLGMQAVVPNMREATAAARSSTPPRPRASAAWPTRWRTAPPSSRSAA